MNHTFDLILQNKLILVLRRIQSEQILDAVTSLKRAGIVLVETTYDHLLEDPIKSNVALIKLLVKEFGTEMCIGAGTVLTVDEVHAAHDAGAKYIVSPNCNPLVVSATKKLGLVSIPGAMTPTEIVSAYGYGADIVKLFPADDLGYHYIKNVLAPLTHIPLLASGGVNVETIPKFFESGICAVATGISILEPSLIKYSDWSAIEELARNHVAMINAWHNR